MTSVLQPWRSLNSYTDVPTLEAQKEGEGDGVLDALQLLTSAADLPDYLMDFFAGYDNHDNSSASAPVVVDSALLPGDHGNKVGDDVPFQEPQQASLPPSSSVAPGEGGGEAAVADRLNALYLLVGCLEEDGADTGGDLGASGVAQSGVTTSPCSSSVIAAKSNIKSIESYSNNWMSTEVGMYSSPSSTQQYYTTDSYNYDFGQLKRSPIDKDSFHISQTSSLGYTPTDTNSTTRRTGNSCHNSYWTNPFGEKGFPNWSNNNNTNFPETQSPDMPAESNNSDPSLQQMLNRVAIKSEYPAEVCNNYHLSPDSNSFVCTDSTIQANYCELSPFSPNSCSSSSSSATAAFTFPSYPMATPKTSSWRCSMDMMISPPHTDATVRGATVTSPTRSSSPSLIATSTEDEDNEDEIARPINRSSAKIRGVRVDRRLRRREQNRQAARRCRQRKKEQSQELIKEYYQLLSSNSEIQSDLKTLEAERNRLQDIYNKHLNQCCLNPKMDLI